MSTDLHWKINDLWRTIGWIYCVFLLLWGESVALFPWFGIEKFAIKIVVCELCEYLDKSISFAQVIIQLDPFWTTTKELTINWQTHQSNNSIAICIFFFSISQIEWKLTDRASKNFFAFGHSVHILTHCCRKQFAISFVCS